MERMTNAEIEALCGEVLLAIRALERTGYPVCADNVTKALTAIRQLQQPWRGMESMKLWDVGFVTDGENAAKRKRLRMTMAAYTSPLNQMTAFIGNRRTGCPIRYPSHLSRGNDGDNSA